MFGRLPMLHRWVVAGCVVLLFTSIGAWMGTSPQVPVLVPGATSVALVFGVVVAWLLVRHDQGQQRR